MGPRYLSCLHYEVREKAMDKNTLLAFLGGKTLGRTKVKYKHD